MIFITDFTLYKDTWCLVFIIIMQIGLIVAKVQILLERGLNILEHQNKLTKCFFTYGS